MGFVNHRLILTIILFALIDAECPTCTGPCSKESVDLTFVVDGSGSICEGEELNCHHWKDMLQLVKNTVDLLTIGPSNARVGFVQFSNRGHKEFGLKDYTSKASLQDAIEKVQHRGGNTNTSGGIRVMRSQIFFKDGDRSDVQNVAVVITDGKSTRDPDKTIPEARAAMATGIRMYVVGVTDSIDAFEVKDMSSAPQRQNVTYWLFRDFHALHGQRLLEGVFATMCMEPASPEPGIVEVSLCPGTQIGTDCFIVRDFPLDRPSAESDCQNLSATLGRTGKGHLAEPSTSDIHRTLEELLVAFMKQKSSLEQHSLRDFWVGGGEESFAFGGRDYPPWRWLPGSKPLSSQGCFADEPNDRDLSYRRVIPDLTPAKCLAICQHYKYAALQGGNVCSCGNSYGKHGITEGCTAPCTGDPGQTCGGLNQNAVFILDGAYSNWSPGQPSNHRLYQPCGHLERSSSGQWLMGDKACYETFSYICQVPMGACSSRKLNHHVSDRKCIHIESGELTWFEARQVCIAESGDLVVLDSDAAWRGVSELLTSVYSASAPWWVGATARFWYWSVGTQFFYTKWSPSEPNEASHNCLKMALNYADEALWEDEDCSRRLPHICRIDMSGSSDKAEQTTVAPKPIKPSTVKSTTLTPTLTSTLTPVTTELSAVVNVTSTSNQTEGKVDASTSLENTLHIYEAVLIAIIMVLFLVALVIVGVGCWHKQQHKKVSGFYATQSTEPLQTVSAGPSLPVTGPSYSVTGPSYSVTGTSLPVTGPSYSVTGSDEVGQDQSAQKSSPEEGDRFVNIFNSLKSGQPEVPPDADGYDVIKSQSADQRIPSESTRSDRKPRRKLFLGKVPAPVNRQGSRLAMIVDAARADVSETTSSTSSGHKERKGVGKRRSHSQTSTKKDGSSTHSERHRSLGKDVTSSTHSERHRSLGKDVTSSTHSERHRSLGKDVTSSTHSEDFRSNSVLTSSTDPLPITSRTLPDQTSGNSTPARRNTSSEERNRVAQTQPDVVVCEDNTVSDRTVKQHGRSRSRSNKRSHSRGRDVESTASDNTVDSNRFSSNLSSSCRSTNIVVEVESD